MHLSPLSAVKWLMKIIEVADAKAMLDGVKAGTTVERSGGVVHRKCYLCGRNADKARCVSRLIGRCSRTCSSLHGMRVHAMWD